VKITDALKIMQEADAAAPPFRAVLACGFTPLHLQTFLAARLQQRQPGRRVTIQTGLYGDIPGTLAAIQPKEVQAIAVVVEWPDLDPRLGYRGEGKWGLSATRELVSVAGLALDRIVIAVEAVPAEIPIAVLLPTLPPTPLFHVPEAAVAEIELELEQVTLEWGRRLAGRRNCFLVNRNRLAEESPPGSRFDLKSDLLKGLPYTISHADAVAEALARLLVPAAPKKGLISDLDDTLWFGIVGEIGSEGVSWDMAGHTQLHGLYQQLLSALAEEGVLIGIVSKNDPAIVKQAFARSDLRLRPEQVYPIEVSWNVKSAAVSRILQAWNIGADSVVFVDDSPMELAEVKEAHPGIECMLFPKDDYGAAYSMLRRLRDLFGKPRISDEDRIRLESIRSGAVFQSSQAAGEASEVFLQRADAVLRTDWQAAEDPRALELVNKTNQFNLNGIRYTPAEWKQRVSRSGAWMMVVSYDDKFGPLGKIAVIQGREPENGVLCVENWVMSCRAFSRRIEHQCLKRLFDRYGVQQIAFDFQVTAKNGPSQDFFASFVGEKPASAFILTRAQFEKNCPPLYHRALDSFEAAV